MIPVINSIHLADKLAAIRRRELPNAAAQLEASPWIREVLCSLAWHSAQPGGFEQLAESVMDASAELIGPEAPGQPAGRRQVEALLRQIPGNALSDEGLLGGTAWLFVAENPPAMEGTATVERLDLCFLAEDADTVKPHGRDKRSDKADLVERLGKLSLETIKAYCRAEAAKRLPRYFADLCLNWSQDFKDPGWWFLRNPIGALRKHAGVWAANQLSNSAATAVSASVADGLNYAWQKRRTVWVDGIHRRGKTWTLEGYCNAYPGRARYVRVPPSDSDSELFRRVARALGIPYSINAPPSHLRELIADVLAALGLVLVLDEAQFLYGTRISKTSKPTRLEWCREIIDAGNPCVICTSPQSYEQAEKQFFAKTRYPMGQWLGRWIRTIHIPDLLDDEDLLGVTRKHFPQASDALLVEIAGRSAEHHGYLKAIEEVRTTAEYLSEKAGAAKLTDRLILQALDEVLPREEIPAAEPAEDQPAAALQPVRNSRARGMQPTRSGTVGNRFTVSESESGMGLRISDPSAVPA